MLYCLESLVEDFPTKIYYFCLWCRRTTTTICLLFFPWTVRTMCCKTPWRNTLSVQSWSINDQTQLLLNTLNPLSASPIKWSNTLKKFVGCCRRIGWVRLTILRLVLKGLNHTKQWYLLQYLTGSKKPLKSRYE